MHSLWTPFLCALILTLVVPSAAWSYALNRMGLTGRQGMCIVLGLLVGAWASVAFSQAMGLLASTPLLCLPLRGVPWRPRTVSVTVCQTGIITLTCARLAKAYPYQALLGLDIVSWAVTALTALTYLLAPSARERTLLLVFLYMAFAAPSLFDAHPAAAIIPVCGFWVAFVTTLLLEATVGWRERHVSRLGSQARGREGMR